MLPECSLHLLVPFYFPPLQQILNVMDVMMNLMVLQYTSEFSTLQLELRRSHSPSWMVTVIFWGGFWPKNHF
jgi:hypothetical protein